MPREDDLTVFEMIFGVTDPDYRDGFDDIDPELERLNKADFEWKQMAEDRISRR